MNGRTAAYVRFLAGLRGFLNDPIDYARARSLVAARLRDREGAFLRFVRLCVCGNPNSPYLRLLEQAGWDYPRIEAELCRSGLEALLGRLAEDGVRLSFDEFKGRAPISRDGLEIRPRPRDLDNRRVRAGCPVRSGGSTGGGLRTAMDLEFLAVRASLDRIAFHALGLEGAPLALWYPGLPAVSGFGNSLRCAKAGQLPERWFEMGIGFDATGRCAAIATRLAVWLSRFSRSPLASPEPVDPDNLDTVLDWMGGALERAGRCVVRTYVSRAVRLSQRACQTARRLDGACFMVSSEPLTPVRSDEITLSGARVFPRYGCTELGSIGVACTDPVAPGDMHVASDVVALTQPPGGQEAERPFRFTSLLTCTPKVMLNAELGDRGIVLRRGCSCPFGELGLDTHFLSVHSIEKVNAEGMTVPVAGLIGIVEEALCPCFGGSPLHYQWVERQEAGGIARLLLRIAPEVGEVDVAAAARKAFAEVSRRSAGGRIASDVWASAGTLKVVREPPLPTGFGKLLPFVRE